jgi:predicted ATPase/DNA-binding XRE family transcriptional regulator
MQEDLSFGTWLRKQRRALDLTRQAFADQVGCAEVTLRRIEAGTLKPSKELANILLEKIGIPETERPQWISFARGLSGLPSRSVPSSTEPKSNLPAPVTTFVGRKKEQADVSKLITKRRLVTLTGPGGVGKTRLSVKVGEQALGNYTDGVWLVELASLSNAALISQTFAALFGLTAQSTAISYTDLLINFLQAKAILLVVDNCEHLLDACAHLIDTLLKSCPHLKILATSREPLGITGESLYLVPSLELPDLQQLIDSFRDFESVHLFEERAQLIQFDFSLTLENAASVAQICQRLDGIPLAIELAAAKVGMLSTEQIAKQLDESFNLLAQGSRTALPRHQTLRASINWSWDLLTESEQRLMWQLSVFAGGWTLEAAQSVCDGDVLYLLNSLVSKSLIVMNPRGEANARHSFHETIRQYAREKLLEAGGVEALRDKHLAYFVRFTEQFGPELYRSNQIFWSNKLGAELDNIRLTMEWALTTDLRSGLRLILNWIGPWGEHGDVHEVISWLEQILEKYHDNDALRARALIIYGNLLMAASRNHAQAQRLANESLALARLISDKHAEAFSLWGLGVATANQGDTKQGIALIEQSLALCRLQGDQLGQALATMWLCIDRNDLARSKSFSLESLRLYRELGHLRGIAECLMDLGETAIWEGDFSSAVPWLNEAKALFGELGKQEGEAFILNDFGKIAYYQGDYLKAGTCFEEAITLFEKVGFGNSDGARINMAYALFRQGDFAQAIEMFKLGIQQFQKTNSVMGLVHAVEGLASLYVNQNHTGCATQLFAWTDAIRGKTGERRPTLDQESVESDLAVIHTKLNEKEIAKLWKEGRTMTVERAIALALEPAEKM